MVALNGLRRWLPVLTALDSNSPFWKGADSGFASRRNIHYRPWSVHGIPPRFADALDCERRMRLILEAEWTWIPDTSAGVPGFRSATPRWKSAWPMPR